jgi:hypothetical protein
MYICKYIIASHRITYIASAWRLVGLVGLVIARNPIRLRAINAPAPQRSITNCGTYCSPLGKVQQYPIDPYTHGERLIQHTSPGARGPGSSLTFQ